MPVAPIPRNPKPNCIDRQNERQQHYGHADHIEGHRPIVRGHKLREILRLRSAMLRIAARGSDATQTPQVKPAGPMVLHAKVCGSVGRRRHKIKRPIMETWSAFSFRLSNQRHTTHNKPTSGSRDDVIHKRDLLLGRSYTSSRLDSPSSRLIKRALESSFMTGHMRESSEWRLRKICSQRFVRKSDINSSATSSGRRSRKGFIIANA